MRIANNTSCFALERTALVLFLFLFLFLSCGPPAAQAQETKTTMLRDSITFVSMGCRTKVVVLGRSHEENRRWQEEVRNQMSRIESIASFHRQNSEASRLQGTGRVRPSLELVEILQTAKRCHRETDGFFDVTLGGQKALWKKTRSTHNMPPPEALADAGRASGMEKIEVAPPFVILHDPALKLDLSGIAKGYAVDTGIDYLKSVGALGGMINAGGDLRVFGTDGDDSEQGWRIGVEDPRPEKGLLGVVHLADRAIATSGSYEQFAEVDGQILGHIFDPHRIAFQLPGKLVSVTILHERCAVADATATAVFAMGLDRGLRFLRGKDRGIGYLLIEQNGDRLTLHKNIDLLDVSP